MHVLCRKGEKLPILRVDRNLPKTFGKVHAAEDAWIVELLQRILDAREREHNFVTLVINLSEIRQKAIPTGLLLCQKNRGGVGAGRMGHQAIRNHLVRLIIDDLSKFGTRSVGRDRYRRSRRILEMRPVLD